MTPELVVGNTFMCVSVLQAGPCFRILYNSPNGEHGILRFDEYFKIKSIFVRPFLHSSDRPSIQSFCVLGLKKSGAKD